MLKVEKEVTITISGNDVDTLSNICNCVRVYMGNFKLDGYNWRSGDCVVGAYSGKEAYAIGEFIDKIFEA